MMCHSHKKRTFFLMISIFTIEKRTLSHDLNLYHYHHSKRPTLAQRSNFETHFPTTRMKDLYHARNSGGPTVCFANFQNFVNGFDDVSWKGDADVCVCERKRNRVRERPHMCVSECEGVRACACMHVYECV